MPRNPAYSMIFTLLLAFGISEPQSRAEPLAALFQNRPLAKKKAPKVVRLPIPHEYLSYSRAKSLLRQKASVAKIESLEREVLLSPLGSETRGLEKDLTDQFYALEIKKGVSLVKNRHWAPAISAFHRGLNGLNTYKWIYYWGEDASRALAQMCTRNKKKKDEECLTLAKRLVEAFPKVALETKVLRDLPALDMTSVPENNVERLSQSYTEKTEKDEEAFQEVLDNYLNGRDSDLQRSAKEFITEYPRSSLRFRASFLMAESHRKNHREKEAQPLYQSLIDQVPLSYYSIVSSERLQVNLRDRVKKDAIDIDVGAINPNLYERITLARAKALYSNQLNDEVGIELESLARVKNYNTPFLLYLMKFASVADQNLVSFKLANELIQRKYDRLLSAEFIDLLFPDRYLKEIQSSSTQYGLDPVLVTSLIKQESGFKANAISSSGALGLMQLMPFTAIDTKKDLWLSTLVEPVSNISVGTHYLQTLLEKYEGNVPYALAAYNAGPHRVLKWKKDIKADWTMIDFIESIPYKETREYVASILRNRFWYQYRKNLPAQRITDLKL